MSIENDLTILRRAYSHYRVTEIISYSEEQFEDFIRSKLSLAPIFRAIIESEVKVIPEWHKLNYIIKPFYQESKGSMTDEEFENFLEQTIKTFPLYIQAYRFKKIKGMDEYEFFEHLQHLIYMDIDTEHFNQKINKICIPFLLFINPNLKYQLKNSESIKPLKIEHIIAKEIKQLIKFLKIDKTTNTIQIVKLWCRFFNSIWIKSKTDKYLEDFFLYYLGDNTHIGLKIIKNPVFIKNIGIEITNIWRKINFKSPLSQPEFSHITFDTSDTDTDIDDDEDENEHKNDLCNFSSLASASASS